MPSYKVKIDSFDEQQVQTLINGAQFGDSLIDQSYIEDGFRYHDLNHLIFLEVYKWSPICSTKSGIKEWAEYGNPYLPKIEEVISYLVFGHWKYKWDLGRTIDQISGILDPHIQATKENHQDVVEKCCELWDRIELGKSLEFNIYV